MDLERYEFSKESLPELLEFVKFARNASHSNPLSTIWGNYLPKNAALEKEIADFEAGEANRSIIDLTENEVSHERSDEVPLEEHPPQELDTTYVDDLITSIVENLTLSDDVVTKLGEECRAESVQNMFGLFCESFDTESVCELGKSIASAKSAHRITVASYFCQFILIPKLFRESNKELTSLFLTYLNSFPVVVSRTFSESLQGYQGCPKKLRSNLHDIPSDHKQVLLKDLIMRTTNLEGTHVEIIDCLSTSELNAETFQKLTELLTAAGGYFSGDKLFGKMLLNLVNSNGVNARRFEEHLRHIIGTHRSVWKGKILKALEAACTVDEGGGSSSMLFSQTLRY